MIDKNYTWNMQLPCRNPSCKNHGSPHPNCKCYEPDMNSGAFAEGGDVAGFCSSDRSHKEDCEYFATGGDAGVPSWDSLSTTAPTPTPESSSAPAQPEQESTPSWDSLSATKPADEAPSWDSLSQDNPTDKYSGAGEGAIAGVEGLAKGYLSPLITVPAEAALNAAGVPDLTPEDIAGREATHPYISHSAEAAGLGLGFMTGTGEAGLIAKGAGRLAPEAATVLGKIGAGVFKGAIESGAIQGGDEIGKAMLGQGDPEAPVSAALAHIGAAALLGGVTGSAFSGSKVALKALGNAKMGTKANAFLVGMGAGSEGVPAAEMATDEMEKLGFDATSYKAGAKFFQNTLPKVISGAAGKLGKVAGTVIGAKTGGISGALGGAAVADALAPTIEKVVGRTLTGATQRYGWAITSKALSLGQALHLGDLLDHGADVSKGAQKINSGIDALFKVGGQTVVNAAAASDRDREKLRDFIENGEQNKQIKSELQQQQQDQDVPHFAEGGMVKNVKVDTTPAAPILQGTDALSRVYPDQSMLMQAAKGRINNYLNSQRPLQTVGKAPFDEEIKDKEKERSYNRALDIANQPLSMLSHIKEGTLTPEHMQHFTALYPELYSHLQKKITEKITDAQLNDEKPSYRVRQGLSLFMGTALDGTLTPANIQAAQGVFAQQAQQQASQAPPTKNKKGTSSLSKVSSQYETADQARQQRLSK